MSFPYQAFSYIKVPRTKSELTPPFMPRYEGQGWWAQFKRNGTNSTIYVDPDRNVDGWNRHGQRHASFKFDEVTSAIFRTLAGRKWFAFNGELMRDGPRFTHYLFDVLVYDGQYLHGMTYAERYKLLNKLFRKAGVTLGHFVLDEHTWLARNHTSGFPKLFEAQDQAMDEGLMLKNPEGRLIGNKADGWMVKIKH